METLVHIRTLKLRKALLQEHVSQANGWQTLLETMLEARKFKTWCQQGLFPAESHIKVYPSPCEMHSQYGFLCELNWLTLHKIFM